MLAVGVDGGGTKCRAVVLDGSGKQLGEKVGESSNTKSIGEDKANENLRSTIEGALSAAGKSFSDVGSICLGMAGVDRPADKAILEKFVRTFLPQKDLIILIENDGIVALASGTGGILSGVVVISGTGTITYGVLGNERLRCQGWGPLLGDEGGGSDMGLHCVKAVSRSVDGGRKTLMTDMVVKELKLEDAWGLIDWCYGDAFTFAKFAALAPIVLNAAKQGDDVALSILEQKAEAIVESIRIVAAKLQFPSNFSLVLAGGNLTHEDGKGLFSSILQRKLRFAHPLANVVFPSVDPTVAAAQIALNALTAKK
jgi:N-acetylglucosamine kinase-like BadF-type ATPase